MFSLQLIGLGPNTVPFASSMKDTIKSAGLSGCSFVKARSSLELGGVGQGRIPL